MKSFKYFVTVVFFSTPVLAFAATTSSLQGFLKNIIPFISSRLIPFLFGMAFLLFIINVIRYFVIDADNKDVRENAKNVALYSVFAFVFLIIFWGVVNLLISSSGFSGNKAPCPDYLKDAKGGC
ncbi:MAG: hypothetical protein Q7T50_02100 [Candidatus Magasanikbacteria bacterium]|nr:hypothetical protein [Candidatus Magasanikbacteria bacterium]